MAHWAMHHCRRWSRPLPGGTGRAHGLPPDCYKLKSAALLQQKGPCQPAGSVSACAFDPHCPSVTQYDPGLRDQHRHQIWRTRLLPAMGRWDEPCPVRKLPQDRAMTAGYWPGTRYLQYRRKPDNQDRCCQRLLQAVRFHDSSPPGRPGRAVPELDVNLRPHRPARVPLRATARTQHTRYAGPWGSSTVARKRFATPGVIFHRRLLDQRRADRPD